MDWKDIDEKFSELSEGVLALVAGVAIIITITFFIYEITPLFSENIRIFTFSIFALIVCVVASISFYLSEITLLPDVVGKLITGLTATIFGVILFHVSNSYSISFLPEIVLIGFLGIASALPLAKGVLIPLFGEDMTFTSETEEEETFEDHEEDEVFETEIDDEDETLDIEVEDDIEKPKKEKKESKDHSRDNEPW